MNREGAGGLGCPPAFGTDGLRDEGSRTAELPLWAHTRSAELWDEVARMVAVADRGQALAVARALQLCGVPWWTAGPIANLNDHPDYAARWRRRHSLRAAQDRIWLAPLNRRRDLANALAAAGVLDAATAAVCGLHDRERAA